MKCEQVRVSGALDIPLRRQARVRGSATAVRTPQRDYTYAELDREVDRVAAGMVGAGLRRGGSLAIFMPNSAEWVIAYLAGARLGAVATPVNILASSAEADAILGEVECDVLVTTSELVDHCTSAAGRVTVVVGDDERAFGEGRVAWTLLGGDRSCIGSGPAATDVASLYYSSATTGRSKAAVTLHSDITLNSMHQIIEMGLTESDVHLVTASMSWAAGLHGLTLATLYAGGTIVLPDLGAMTSDKLAQAIEQWQPTTVILVPTLLRRLVGDAEAIRRLRESNLRLVLTGAEPVPLPLFEQVTEELPNVAIMQSYGMSEFPLMISILRPEHVAERAGSAGLPTMFTELAILLDDGSVGPNGEGEILLRTASTTRQYWQREEETATGMRDGWLHTGDLGRIDDDGFLWITGRSKDLIITGGLNVAPLEVEKVLTRALGGREVAVVGAPDEEFGERIVAVLGGTEQVDVQFIDQECRAHLPSYKVPRAVYTFGDELPKGPTGKLLKRAIRDWLASGDPCPSGE